MALCLSVCLSVTSRCSITTAERIDLILAWSFLRLTLHYNFKEIRVSPKYGYSPVEFCPRLWTLCISPRHIDRRNVLSITYLEKGGRSERDKLDGTVVVMPNSHRPPHTTRRSCLCRVRRCELSLEAVWQSLNSQPIYHARRVAFSEEV